MRQSFFRWGNRHRIVALTRCNSAIMIAVEKRLEQLAAVNEANNRALAKLAQAVALKLRQRGVSEAEIQVFVTRVTTRQNKE